ncbi:MAG: DNA circularization N-terminal domain-containing protein [Myxococcales bacterium]|nr:DNA circularization N-terminal domain-containing protein [Myxococcales bacterium]
MTWVERAHRASFRGVPFHLVAIDAERGRKTATHEFADTQALVVDDFGARAPTYRITALVAGDDYDLDRDTLEAALLARGAGELSLPNRPTVRAVIVDGPRARTEGAAGAATIEFSAREVADRSALLDAPDPLSAARTRAAAARTHARTALLDGWLGSSAVAEIARSAGRSLDTASATLADVTARIGSASRDISGAIDQATRRAYQIRELAAGAEAIADALADALGLSYAAGARAIDAADGALQAVRRSIIGASLVDATQTIIEAAAAAPITPYIPGHSRMRERQRGQHDALRRSIMLSALAEMAAVAPALRFASAGDAAAAMTAIRPGLLMVMDEMLAADADSYSIAEDAATVIRSALTEQQRTAPRSSILVLDRALPAVLLAHYAYGDARRAEEIVARNKIDDPMWIAPGTAVELLHG